MYMRVSTLRCGIARRVGGGWVGWGWTRNGRRTREVGGRGMLGNTVRGRTARQKERPRTCAFPPPPLEIRAPRWRALRPVRAPTLIPPGTPAPCRSGHVYATRATTPLTDARPKNALVFRNIFIDYYDKRYPHECATECDLEVAVHGSR